MINQNYYENENIAGANNVGMPNNVTQGQNMQQNNVLPMQNYSGNQKKVTTLEELEEYSKGDIVRLPDFAQGKEFYARIRRPSLLKLVEAGKIPNTLLTTANKLFTTSFSGEDTEDTEMMRNMISVIDVICEASFVEPTYEQLNSRNIQLTDEQYMFIFNYSQTGATALAPFSE